MLYDLIDRAAAGLVNKIDEEIKAALDARWPDGWTEDHVRQHCTLVRVVGSPVETLVAEGVSLLELHPVESEIGRRDHDVQMIRYTRKFRRLY